MISFSLFAPLLFNSIMIIGIWKIFSQGMVLEDQGAWIERKLGEFWSKPVISCPPCMASVHGTYFYFAYISHDMALFLPYILALCGLNVMAMALYSFLMNDK